MIYTIEIDIEEPNAPADVLRAIKFTLDSGDLQEAIGEHLDAMGYEDVRINSVVVK